MMNFRIYNKTCSMFNLMSKEKGVKHTETEPNQTKGLGYLLSKSYSAMKAFCGLIGETLGKKDSWVVDCELTPKMSTGSLQRIDILIRITDAKGLVRSILIEAKSFNSSTTSITAIGQALRYQKTFGIKTDKIVSITKETEYCSIPTTAIPIKMIRWRDILNELVAIKNKDIITQEYIKYLIKCSNTMKYYDDEVLTIPAGKSIKAVRKSLVYMCPSSFATSKKNPIFVAFRESGGKVTELFKVLDKFIMDPNDCLAIADVCKYYPDFNVRVADYKSITSIKPGSSTHCIFYLDKSFIIKLPHPVFIKTTVPSGKGSGVRTHTALPLNAMFVNIPQIFGKISVTP